MYSLFQVSLVVEKLPKHRMDEQSNTLTQPVVVIGMNVQMDRKDMRVIKRERCLEKTFSIVLQGLVVIAPLEPRLAHLTLLPLMLLFGHVSNSLLRESFLHIFIIICSLMFTFIYHRTVDGKKLVMVINEVDVVNPYSQEFLSILSV